MPDKVCDNDKLAPILFYYFNMTWTESFVTLLKERFRESGHKRPVVFKEWNCYKELPGTDADLILYDGIVMSALADKGFIDPIPDDISAGDVFSWVADKNLIRHKRYGLPVMMCSNTLICRKQDDRNICNIMELNENTAIPMRSMLMFYFLQTLCTNLNIRKSMKVLEHLLDLTGGRDFLEKSKLADYDGINRFSRKECLYLLAFTENLRDLPGDDYVVRFANFSAEETDRRPRFMVDYISAGKNVTDEKRQDCLDLMKLMADEQFQWDLCTLDGRLQYLLTANRQVFRRLAESDPVYAHLFGLLESDKNGVLRYSKRFYEDFYKHGDILLQFLWERAGWRP